MAANAYPVVSGEGMTVPAGWRTEPITPPWLPAALEDRGWSLVSTQLGELEVRFADGSEAGPLPSPPIQLEGFPGVGSLPVIGFARMSSDFLTLVRETLTLQVVVTQTSDSWAQQWATYILETGEQLATQFGTAVTSDTGVVLSDGELFVNATWWIEGVTLNPVELARAAPSPAGELVALAPTTQ